MFTQKGEWEYGVGNYLKRLIKKNALKVFKVFSLRNFILDFFLTISLHKKSLHLVKNKKNKTRQSYLNAYISAAL